jgi:integrase
MSVRIRTRTDGTSYSQVRFRHHSRETSVSFDDHAEALAFDKLITKVGVVKALEITRIVVAQEQGTTVGQWLTHYIDHLTGVGAESITNYRRYVKKDFGSLVDMPLIALTPDDVAAWQQGLKNLDGTVPSGKTVANKRGFLAGALAGAVQRGHLKSNPCDNIRLPRWDRAEMVFLEPDEYQLLRSEIPVYWRALTDFLVMSGCRWGEATALRPQNVDRKAGTVRISQAWKKADGGGYVLGVPKTKKSVRTINLPGWVVKQLDFSGEFLFTNSGRGRHHAGGVVRNASFAPNVWHPAIDRAQAKGLTKQPRVHDLRHTCASWLINEGRPITAVQEMLGHESIKTTVDLYHHANRASGKENADVLGVLIDPLQ